MKDLGWWGAALFLALVVIFLIAELVSPGSGFGVIFRVIERVAKNH